MRHKQKTILICIVMTGLFFCGFQRGLFRERQVMVWNVIENTQTGRLMNCDPEIQKEDDEIKKVALTFDDGPHPYLTEQLLDGLKERAVHVSFFVTGEHAQMHPDIIQRMRDEGHLVGNHTFSHIQLGKKNKQQFLEEIKETNRVLKEITGEETQFVRPPYGSWDKQFEIELNMFPVLWTVDPRDWCSSNVDCITENIVSKVKENDIILMHDYFDTSITAALEVVDELKNKGYTFVTVDELILD